MADILHRLTINATRERVHEMVATKNGVERWWSARTLEGDENAGGKLFVYFGGGADPSAVMEVIKNTPDQVVWRCADGPSDWRDTRITSSSNPPVTMRRRCCSATPAGANPVSS